ncbi:MAG: complex I NDUFA9 subunit family protein [Holosporales bacterium]
MQGHTIGIFGGSGFLGRSIVQQLAKTGATLRVFVRHPEHALHLKTAGEVGQIILERVNILNDHSLEGALEGCEAVVNLVGILAESKPWTFTAVHQDFPARLAKACRAKGITKLVHVSALGVGEDSPSAYARSKAAGEKAILATFPSATILRPSVIFGPDDSFFNRFAEMALVSAALPLIGGGITKLQPVYVGDVAFAVVKVLTDPHCAGKVYELTGPDVLSLRAILQFILDTIQRKRILLNLPFGVAKVMGSILEWVPGKPLTKDQVILLEHDNVATAGALGFADLGMTPQRIATIVPRYLARFRATF